MGQGGARASGILCKGEPEHPEYRLKTWATAPGGCPWSFYSVCWFSCNLLFWRYYWTYRNRITFVEPGVILSEQKKFPAQMLNSGTCSNLREWRPIGSRPIAGKGGKSNCTTSGKSSIFSSGIGEWDCDVPSSI